MPVVEKISSHHDVNSFTCGTRKVVREMNEFLRIYGNNKNYGTTFVLVPFAGSKEVIAYFTLAPDPTRVTQVSTNAKLNDIIFHLRYLAVSQAYQRQGIGERILIHVINEVLTAARTHREIVSLELSALDQVSKDWYLRRDLGFQELVPGSLQLTLSLAPLLALPETTQAD